MEEQNPQDLQEYSLLNIDNVKYRTNLTRTHLMRKPYEPKNEKLVLSFIPGTIVKIYVKKGDKVKPGDKLLVLEAMKMNNELLSPIHGYIQSVNVEQGVRVTKNQCLIEFK